MYSPQLFKVVLFTAFILAPNVVVCQTASEIGLVLNGGPSPSIRPCDGKRDKQDCLRFKMVFENRGKEPVIIINPTLNYGTGIKEALFYYNEYGSEPRTYTLVEGAKKSAEVDPTNRENFRLTAASFDSDRPPENLTIVLQPGENFTFYESFLVKSDERIPEKEFESIRRSHPVYDECDDSGCRRIPRGMKLVYEFSFLPYIKDPEFLEDLAKRWQRYGRLPIGNDGTYTVISEFIR